MAEEFKKAEENWKYFESIKEELLRNYKGKAVVVTEGEYVIANSLKEAYEKIKEKFPTLIHTIEWEIDEEKPKIGV